MNPKNNIEIYQGNDGQTQIDIWLDKGTLWLSQVQMAELFDSNCSPPHKVLSDLAITFKLA